MSGRVLVTGATGFIGGRLSRALAASGREVRRLVRDRGGSRARALQRDGFDVHEGDVQRRPTLRGAGRRIEAAYHIAFARMAREEGTERVIYLGGLGERPYYFRAGMDTLTYIEGLAVPIVVADPSAMKLFEIEPVSFDEALLHAVAEDLELGHLPVTPVSAS